MNSLNKTYELTPENIDVFSEYLRNVILESKIESRVAISICLSVETVLVKWMENLPQGSCFEATTKSSLGRNRIILKAKGAWISIEENSGDDENFFKSMLVNMNASYSSSYIDGMNVFDIRLPRTETGNFAKIAIAVISSIVLGQAILFLMPDKAAFINENLISPLFGMIMGLLSTVAAISVLTSLIAGISCMGNINSLKTMGGKLAVGHLRDAYIFAVVCSVFGLLFFKIPRFNGGISFGLFQNIYQMLLDIVPKDFLSPFIQGNTLQIVFIGFFLGIAILKLGDGVNQVKTFALQINEIFQFLLMSICKALPFVVFLSFLQLVLNNSLMSILGVWQLILAEILMSVFMFTWYAAEASLKTGCSFPKIVRELLPICFLGVTTSSSIACLDASAKLVEEKHNVSRDVANFALPVGLVLSKTGILAHFILLVFSFSAMAGNSLSLFQIIMLIISSVIWSIATPPISGALIAFTNILFIQYDIPIELMGVAIACNFIFDIFATVADCIANPVHVIILDHAIRKNK